MILSHVLFCLFSWCLCLNQVTKQMKCYTVQSLSIDSEGFLLWISCQVETNQRAKVSFHS